MTPVENAASLLPSASEYILDNFEPTERIAMLVLNRDFGETISALPAPRKRRAPNSRPGFVTRMRTARTSIWE
jgi:hypothetical protein